MITSLTGRRWTVRAPDDDRADALRRSRGFLPAVARIAAARGLDELETFNCISQLWALALT